MAWIAINIAILILYQAWWIRVIVSEFRYYRTPVNKQIYNTHPSSVKPSFSIIIAYRDEQNRLQPLLNSLLALQFQGDWELIFVNDHSSDYGPKIIDQWIKTHSLSQVKHLSNIQIGKKSAIQLGIQSAIYDWILTTDADCRLPENWIKSFASIILNQPNIKMIIGRVRYEFAPSKHLLSTYELLENQFLIALNWEKTTKKHLGFANAANLCYSKATFLELGGMQNHLKIASGDDTFTAEKFHMHYPNCISFNADPKAIVTTITQSHISDFLNQRLRWFKKTFLQKSQKSAVEQAFLAGILLTIWGLTIYAVYAGYGIYALLPLAFKAFTDWLFGTTLLLWNQYPTKHPYKTFFAIRYWFTIQYLRIPIASSFQTIFLPILGLVSPFLQFSWKKRKYNA